MLPQDRAIPVGQQPGGSSGEPLESADQGVEIAVVIGMVQLQVGDQAQAGTEFHQGAIAFIGLGHQQFPFAVMAVAAEGRHHATDDGRGVVAGGGQQGGHQGAGGGLAVAAGHGDRGLAVDQGSQHIGAVADGQAKTAGLLQFRIAGGNGGADHHKRGVGGTAADRRDGGGILLAEHPHPQLAQLIHHLAVPGVGTGHREAPLGQDSGQCRHADAPHADEVKRLLAIKRGDQGRLRSEGEGQRGGDRKADSVEIRPYGGFGHTALQ